MTLRLFSTCPPGKLHQNCTCPDNWFTCPSLEKMYNILGIMCLGQKMNLPAGQVADKIYLPVWEFNLPWTTGQPLMSHPDSALCGTCYDACHAHISGNKDIRVNTNPNTRCKDVHLPIISLVLPYSDLAVRIDGRHCKELQSSVQTSYLP